MNNNINDLIDTISKMKANGAFKKYIDYIRFPFFKNLVENTIINFDFPLSAFTGPNGTGKSSTLHALWGSSHKKTPYDFWFSTKVDPIIEVSEGGKRHSLIYSYKDVHNNQVEVLKIRIKKRGNPDYWETSRPIIDYGMTQLPQGKRNPPLYGKEVVYLDFRAELSAFDKYFYFGDPIRNSKSKRRQDYLRRKSPLLKRIFDNEKEVIKTKNKDQNELIIELDSKELIYISEILGKNYLSGKILYHKFFYNWGLSILFTTNDFSYSEAFAGSGEFAIFRLVHTILNAPDESLILLDEPEVSLHPGAQEQLKYFLLNQIKLKKHQIILSTHSPTFISELPSNAIKVFYPLPSGKFHIENENSPDVAFYRIGFPISSKKTIFVEDQLAKELVESVINTLDEAKSSLLEVVIFPGGKETIKKHISTYAFSKDKSVYFYFDGDDRVDHFNMNNLRDVDRNTNYLKDLIEKQTKCKFDKLSIPINGRIDNVNEDIKILINYLKYFSEHVYYLPLNTPEEIIWDDDVLQNEDISDIKKVEVKDSKVYKEKFRLLCEEIYGKDLSTFIFVHQNKYLKKWIENKDENFSIINSTLNSIVNHV